MTKSRKPKPKEDEGGNSVGTISSTLRLQDRFTATIDNSISAMTRMVNAIENLNRSADMPNLDKEFGEIRADISIATHALDQFNAELAQTDQHTNTVAQLGAGFGGLSRAIIVANQGLQLTRQIWGGIRQLGGKADQRTSTDARLNLINDGLRTQAELEAQVLQVANDTRMEYAATGSLVAKMGRQDYFKGNNDAALAFAQTLNQGLIVSGASSTEAQGALTQLTQGLASGVLRGEEFNSIMENGSVIAEMMATSLGVTKGQLRSMAEDGKLTTEVVVDSIMGQAAAIEQQFSSMPVTFGQAMTQFDNKLSGLMNSLSQPGQAVDIIIRKIEELNAWLDTTEGAQFMDGVVSGAAAAAAGIGWIMNAAADTYQFFTDNWSLIGPILAGLAFLVSGLALEFTIYKGVLLATQAIELVSAVATAIHTKATLADTSAKAAATAAQWGLNAAMLANPMTWIIVLIVAVIAVIVALTIWIIDLWQTNVDFKVGVISIWNGILDFFDRVPGNFMAVGYGIADAFSWAKVNTLAILNSLVNGAINQINRLIDMVNKIPGVSISALDNVTIGAEVAAEEAAARAGRAASLAQERGNAAAKAAERQAKLEQDSVKWRAEADAKKQKAQEQKATPNVYTGAGAGGYGDRPISVAGGSLDKVGSIGKEVDISNQSLEYMRDIAEIEVLGGIASTIDYVERDSLKLAKDDADIMRQSANSSTNIYYIQYQGGVRIKNDVRKGEDWATIAQQLREESQHEIETGISGIEGVVYG